MKTQDLKWAQDAIAQYMEQKKIADAEAAKFQEAHEYFQRMLSEKEQIPADIRDLLEAVYLEMASLKSEIREESRKQAVAEKKRFMITTILSALAVISAAISAAAVLWPV